MENLKNINSESKNVIKHFVNRESLINTQI